MFVLSGALLFVSQAASLDRVSAPKPVVLPVTLTLTYTETDHGQSSTDGSTTGIVGHGSFSLTTTTKPEPVLHAPAKPQPKGKKKPKHPVKPPTLPLTSVTAGGSYITRYDVSADGNYQGTLVAAFTNKALGMLCLTGVTVVGSYVPGTPFPPSTTTLTSVGGTGLARLVRLTLQAKLTQITGLDTQQLTLTGSTTASLTNAAKPFNADCKAVAQLK